MAPCQSVTPGTLSLREVGRHPDKKTVDVELELSPGNEPVGLMTLEVKLPARAYRFVGGEFVDKGGVQPKNIYTDPKTSDTICIDIASRGGSGPESAIAAGPIARLTLQYEGESPRAPLGLAVNKPQGGILDPTLKKDLADVIKVEPRLTFKSAP